MLWGTNLQSIQSVDLAPKSARAAVEASGLTAGYTNSTVWRDASFSIGRGEFVAVIGPNGAGKTTLFRLLLGLQQPSSGSINVFGKVPAKGNPDIGYVPQRHSIDNGTNIQCLELVKLAYWGNAWGLNPFTNRATRAAMDSLASVGSASLAGKPLSSLSGGELQRVFLAEALVSSPQMLLLDEPLANLDIKRTKDLVGLVSSVVHSRKVTTFLVAHDINPLIKFLDKVIYIANGKVATGTPDQVLTSKRLSDLYGTNVEVLRDSRGNIVIVGGEGHHH